MQQSPCRKPPCRNQPNGMGLDMNTVHIVTTEPLSTRYTKQWYDHLPQQMHDAIEATVGYGIHVRNIDGTMNSESTTPGAFLNFGDTAIYKASQIQTIATDFQNGKVEEGDVFLVTDAWNPMAHMIRYMSALLHIPVTIAGIWHAGTYDHSDIISKEFHSQGIEDWGYEVEMSLFELYDLSFFATDFHYRMFRDVLCENMDIDGYDFASVAMDKVVLTGFPMEYYEDMDWAYVLNANNVQDHIQWSQKEDIVVFPHRLSAEKNPEVFEKVAEILEPNGIKCVMPQKDGLTKDEYHKLLLRSKMVFSANEQETLGIGTFEAMMAGCFPIVPQDLSYAEMYPDHEYARLPNYFYAPGFRNDPDSLAEMIVSRLWYLNKELYATNTPTVRHTRDVFAVHVGEIFQTYFQGSVMYDEIATKIVGAERW